MIDYVKLHNLLIEKVDDGDISNELFSVIDEMAYDEYITEKKTTAEYRLEKFKKKHNYDPKTKTIEINGRRTKFNYVDSRDKSDRSVDACSKYRKNKKGEKDDGIDQGITMNRAAFNQKHPKTHEFIAQHEMGHMVDYHNDKKMNRMSTFTPTLKLPDDIKSMMPKIMKLVKKCNSGDATDSEVKELDNLYGEITNKLEKSDIPASQVNKYNELEHKIKMTLRTTKKKLSEHGTDTSEYKADYYAAKHVEGGNKTARRAMKDVEKGYGKTSLKKISKKVPKEDNTLKMYKKMMDKSKNELEKLKVELSQAKTEEERETIKKQMKIYERRVKSNMKDISKRSKEVQDRFMNADFSGERNEVDFRRKSIKELDKDKNAEYLRK